MKTIDYKEQRRAGLALFHLLSQFAKLLGLFVAGLHLKLCELPGFLTGHEQDQGFKFNGRVVRVVSLFQHQVLKFPD
jgi:hypothetical protein